MYIFDAIDSTAVFSIIQFSLLFTMLRCCSACAHTRKSVYFQPRVATTDENKLLQTCSICREKQRSRRASTRNNRTALVELNANAAIAGQRRLRENEDDILPPSFRQRRALFSSSAAPSAGAPSLNVPLSSLSLPNVFQTPSHLPLSSVFPNLGLPTPSFSTSGLSTPILPTLGLPTPGLLTPGLSTPGLPTPGFPPPSPPRNVLPPNFIRPPRRLRRLSVEPNASFQREHGFADRIELDENSIPFAFVHPANQIHCTRRLDLGGRTKECEHCHALHWLSERLRDSTLASPVFEKCCKKEIVPLSPFPDPPADLQHLLAGDGRQEKEFRHNIRQYNAALAFTSMEYNADTRVTSRGGPKSFHVHGKVYHTQGPLEADSPENARYAQLFFYDPEYATNLRHQRNSELERETMGDLTQMLEH